MYKVIWEEYGKFDIFDKVIKKIAIGKGYFEAEANFNNEKEFVKFLNFQIKRRNDVFSNEIIIKEIKMKEFIQGTDLKITDLQDITKCKRMTVSGVDQNGNQITETVEYNEDLTPTPLITSIEISNEKES